MKYLPLCLLALAACPGDDDGNPGRLWIAPDMRETKLHLVGEEPDPF
jgi:hypothetical protein